MCWIRFIFLYRFAQPFLQDSVYKMFFNVVFGTEWLCSVWHPTSLHKLVIKSGWAIKRTRNCGSEKMAGQLLCTQPAICFSSTKENGLFHCKDKWGSFQQPSMFFASGPCFCICHDLEGGKSQTPKMALKMGSQKATKCILWALVVVDVQFQLSQCSTHYSRQWLAYSQFHTALENLMDELMKSCTLQAFELQASAVCMEWTESSLCHYVQ